MAVLQIILAIIYPGVVYLGLGVMEPRQVALGLAIAVPIFFVFNLGKRVEASGIGYRKWKTASVN